MNLKTLTVLAGAALITWGCGSKGPSIEDLENDELGQINKTVEEVPEIDVQKVEEILQSIPSPLETSFLLKEKGGEYNKTYLNSTDNAKKYTNRYEQALNLGVYGTDMAYANIYGMNADGISYLTTVSGLADDLDIGKYFDLATLKGLINHSDNMDSLLNLTTENFEKINRHFQATKSSQLSILMLVGGWIEGLNLLNEVNISSPGSVEIEEKIGEQKIVLEQFMQLLKMYDYDPKMKAITEDLTKLENLYNQISIEEREGESRMEFNAELGMLELINTTVTVVVITEDQLKQIDETTKAIRKTFIKS